MFDRRVCCTVLASILFLWASPVAFAQETDWEQITPAGESPSPRYAHTMVFDSWRGKVVLFGGYDASKVYCDDTWEWDGTSWTQHVLATHPSARGRFAMVFDDVRGKVVLFGGSNGSSRLQDTWEWDGSSWVDVTPSGAKPTARTCRAAAFDSSRGVMVIFGGNDGQLHL